MRETVMGATAYQAISAHTQGDTCDFMIPQAEAEALVSEMPAFTDEQLFWLRRRDRAVRRELARREAARHEKATDMVVSIVTAAAVAFTCYVAMVLWLL